MKPEVYRSDNNSIKVYPHDSCKSVQNDFTIRLKNNQKRTGVRCITFWDKENTVVISHLNSGKVHLINLNTGKFSYYAYHSHTVRHITVYNDEVISSSWDRSIRVVNAYSLKQRLILRDTMMCGSPFSTVAKLSDGSEFIFGVSYDSDLNPKVNSNIIRKFSLSDGKIVQKISQTGDHQLSEYSGTCLEYDGKLYYVGDSGFLNVFKSDTCELIEENFIDASLRTMILIPKFKKILAADTEGFIHSFCLQTRTCTRTLLHTKNISRIVRMKLPEYPDIIATCSFDGTVRISELPLLNEVAVLPAVNQELWALTVTANNRLITGGTENDILIYDISNLNNIHLTGTMRVYENSYVVCAENNPSIFYTNDINNFEVVSRETNEPIKDKKFQEYILESCNTLNALSLVFGAPKSFNMINSSSRKFFPQLPESF